MAEMRRDNRAFTPPVGASADSPRARPLLAKEEGTLAPPKPLLLKQRRPSNEAARLLTDATGGDSSRGAAVASRVLPSAKKNEMQAKLILDKGATESPVAADDTFDILASPHRGYWKPAFSKNDAGAKEAEKNPFGGQAPGASRTVHQMSVRGGRRVGRTE